MAKSNIQYTLPFGYMLESGDALRVLHAGKLLLELPDGFVIARQSAAQSKTTRSFNGSVNLRHTVRRELRSSTCPEICVQGSPAEIRGIFPDQTSWSLTLSAGETGLKFHLTVPGFTEVGLSFLSDNTERFLGFGEQFTHLDLSGKAFALCTTEQGIGRGAQPVSALVNLVSPGSAGDAFTTYAPQPAFITNTGRSLCFEQQSIYWCDIRKSNRRRASFTVWGNILSGVLFDGETPLELIEKHTAVTGRLRPLPSFAYGSILGVRGGRQKAEAILENCRKADAPVTALWVEDWQGKRGKNGGPPLWWRWYPDESLYPDFKNWAAQLRREGIALMGYANPFLSLDEGNRLYVEGREKRYFVQNPDGTDFISHFFTGPEYKYVLVDLTNPEAYDWLKDCMREGMVENGLSGWMADYGEYIPLSCKVHGGSAVEAHCALPVLWARLNAELIDECGGRGELLAFHRSGGPGSNRYAAAYWAGDQNPTFDRHDGLASAITALLSSGISGMSVNHTDIGGYTTLFSPIYNLTRKKEVLLRWLEFAAFTPIFRTHDGSFSHPDNYQFYDDAEGYAAYARFGRVHAALGWYLAQLEREAVGRGYPMVRALCLHYPEDPRCWKIKTQFLLGPDLLVNPVCRSGADSVRAYLPAGRWLCPHTGKIHEGSREAKLPAPIGSPAVLIRADSPDAGRLYETLRGAFGADAVAGAHAASELDCPPQTRNADCDADFDRPAQTGNAVDFTVSRKPGGGDK